ncbi:multi antimicrobial extrusion protein, partial [Kipferlia bialata]
VILPWCGGRVDWSIIKDILSIGVGMLISRLPPTLGTIISNAEIRYIVDHDSSVIDTETLGNALVASFGIFSRVSTLVFMPTTGLTQGLMPIVGFNLGCRQWDRIRRATYYVMWTALVVSALTVILCEVFAEGLIHFFSHDAVVLDKAPFVLRISLCLSWLQFLPAMAAVLAQVHRDVGVNIRVQLFKPLLEIALLFALPRFMGLTGVYLTKPVSEFCAAVYGVVQLRRYLKSFDTKQSLDESEGGASNNQGEREESHPAVEGSQPDWDPTTESETSG